MPNFLEAGLPAESKSKLVAFSNFPFLMKNGESSISILILQSSDIVEDDKIIDSSGP